MLKFKAKKKIFFPKFSLLIWVLTLIAVILALYFNQKDTFNQRYAINPAQFGDYLNQSWLHIFKLISSLFLHGSWQHWAGNMILFLIIALPMEKKIGSFWFIVIYFTSGFAANISSIYQLTDSNNYLLGASGAVSGLLGAWLTLNPSQKISIIIPIGLYLQKAKIPITVLAIIWLSLQISLQLISSYDYPVVWTAHIVGFILGFLMAWLYRLIN